MFVSRPPTLGVSRLRLSLFLRTEPNKAMVSLSPTDRLQFRASRILVRPKFDRTYYQVLTGRNIGFLNYWTPAQIPNLLIASPVLAISVIGIYRYFSSSTSLPNIVVPLVVHHAVMTALLVFGSHTQIALRVISTDPVFWWLLADISFPRGSRGISTIGKIWVWWSVIWGAISIVLWAGHYPPA
jgi:Gpi18-like mannosyltransferase